MLDSYSDAENMFVVTTKLKLQPRLVCLFAETFLYTSNVDFFDTLFLTVVSSVL